MKYRELIYDMVYNAPPLCVVVAFVEGLIIGMMIGVSYWMAEMSAAWK